MDLGTLEDRSYKALLAREARYEREVQIALRDALDGMRMQMAKLYERYATDGLLTKGEMTRYNRLATAERQLLETLDPAIRANLRTMRRLSPEQYEAAFFRHAWAIDQAAEVRIAWGVLNRDVILENLASEFAKISLERYGAEARFRVRAALNEGLSLGKSYPRMANDLKKALDTTYARAIRIVRTEGQTAVNAGQDDAYTRAREKGVDLKIIWDATLDDRTRPAKKSDRGNHRAADGQIKRDDGTFRVTGEVARYPGDPNLSSWNRINCRCRERAQIEGYAPQLRRSRDGGIRPYQTYEEWDKGREHISPTKPKAASATVPRLPRVARPSAPEPELPSFVEHKPGSARGPSGFKLPKP